MKQLLYVYIPGFEYDSVGPLHIDAIKLDVKVAEDNTSTSGNNNSLKTYCYISSTKKLLGDLLYRATGTLDLSNFYPGESGESLPTWTNVNEKGRIPFGMFYDFVTNNNENNTNKYHHVIGIHNTVDYCLNSSQNQDINEHDGLFLVEIEQLNVDLVLTFTFYSKIGNSQAVNNIIEIDAPNKLFNSLDSKFTKLHTFNIVCSDLEHPFLNDYIEIGTWTQTYNPATSGMKEGNFKSANFVNLYYNLKTFETAEKLWEIPVNAGMLVSNMRSELGISLADGKKIYPQYVYDKENLIHIPGTNLDCNKNKGTNTTTDFYTNFYLGFQNIFFEADNFKENNTLADLYMERNEFASSAESTNTAYWVRDFISGSNFIVKKENSFNYPYKLSCINVQTLDYLYNDKPKVCIVNLLDTPDFGNPNWDASLVFSSNTHTKNLKNNNEWVGILSAAIFNFECMSRKEANMYNSYKVAGNADHRYITDSWTTEEVSWWRSEERIPSINLSCKQINPDNSEKLVFLLSNLLFNKKQENSSWEDTNESASLRKYALISLELDEEVPENTDYPAEKYYYCGGIEGNSFFTSNILSTGETEKIELNGKENLVKFNINISNYNFPTILWGGSNNWGMIPVSSLSGWIPGMSPIWDTSYTKGDPTKGQLEFMFLLTYDHKKYWNDYKISDLHFGIPQMLQIDLSLSSISYDNVADRRICPYIIYENSGYLPCDSNGSVISVNVPEYSKNLLVNESGDEFELVKLFPDRCKRVMDLLLTQYTKFDSTFCNDKRFIGKTSSEGSSLMLGFNNLTRELEEGFYILKVLTLYPVDILTIRGTLDGNSFELKNTRNILYVKNSTVITLTNLEMDLTYMLGITPYYNVISGIGLYKVESDDLSNPMNIQLNLLTPEHTTFLYEENGIDDPKSAYNSVILPAIFCAKENITICNRLVGYRGNMARTTSGVQRARVNNTSLINGGSTGTGNTGINIGGDTVNPGNTGNLGNSTINIQITSSAEGYTYNSAYDNDYCTSENDDPVKHFYNFSYLPDKAVYDVKAFYEIPTGKEIKAQNIYLWKDPSSSDLQRFTQIKNIQIRSNNE